MRNTLDLYKMHAHLFYQTLFLFLNIDKCFCFPIESKESKSGDKIGQSLDNDLVSLKLLLQAVSMYSNLTTGDPELDALFRDELIPELYSLLDG